MPKTTMTKPSTARAAEGNWFDAIEGPTRLSGLRNCLSVARDRFIEDAKLMRQARDTGGNAMMTPGACASLALQFDHQAEEAGKLLELFEDAERVLLERPIPEEEDGPSDPRLNDGFGGERIRLGR